MDVVMDFFRVHLPASKYSTASNCCAPYAGTGSTAGKNHLASLGIVECRIFVDRLKPYADRSKSIMNASKVED